MLNFTQGDTKTYTYCRLHRVILKFIQFDTKVYTGWYWTICSAMLQFIQNYT